MARSVSLLLALSIAGCASAPGEEIVEDGADALGACVEATVGTRLNLRKAPRTDAPVVVTMTPGSKVTVLESQAGWARVRTAASEGWAKVDWLSCDADTRPSMTAPHVAPGTIAVDGAIDPAWSQAEAVTFDTIWSGERTGTSTTVRALWSEDALYMLWELDGARLNADATRPVDVEHESLFAEDCVEVFLAPDPAERKRYFEIELGPFGHFKDLTIDKTSGYTDDPSWSSGADVRTHVDRERGHVVIEVALRGADVVSALRRGARLPMNLYRLEGIRPARQYLAWSPTRTPQPNFHVPEAFGTLALE